MGLQFTFFFFSYFLKAKPTAYGRSQARGQIRATDADLQPQQRGIWAASATYTTDHSNIKSLTHWVRSGIESMSSWILVRFINAEAWKELLIVSNVVYYIWWGILVTVEAKHEWWQGFYGKISVPSAYDCCEPKTAAAILPPWGKLIPKKAERRNRKYQVLDDTV